MYISHVICLSGLQVGVQLEKTLKRREAFWEGSQHHYYSVCKDIYFPQKPMIFKSKKVKFPKGNFFTPDVWLHKFPLIFNVSDFECLLLLTYILIPLLSLS